MNDTIEVLLQKQKENVEKNKHENKVDKIVRDISGISFGLGGLEPEEKVANNLGETLRGNVTCTEDLDNKLLKAVTKRYEQLSILKSPLMFLKLFCLGIRQTIERLDRIWNSYLSANARPFSEATLKKILGFIFTMDASVFTEEPKIKTDWERRFASERGKLNGLIKHLRQAAILFPEHEKACIEQEKKLLDERNRHLALSSVISCTSLINEVIKKDAKLENPKLWELANNAVELKGYFLQIANNIDDDFSTKSYKEVYRLINLVLIGMEDNGITERNIASGFLEFKKEVRGVLSKKYYDPNVSVDKGKRLYWEGKMYLSTNKLVLACAVICLASTIIGWLLFVPVIVPFIAGFVVTCCSAVQCLYETFKAAYNWYKYGLPPSLGEIISILFLGSVAVSFAIFFVSLITSIVAVGVFAPVVGGLGFLGVGTALSILSTVVTIGTAIWGICSCSLAYKPAIENMEKQESFPGLLASGLHELYILIKSCAAVVFTQAVRFAAIAAENLDKFGAVAGSKFSQTGAFVVDNSLLVARNIGKFITDITLAITPVVKKIINKTLALLADFCVAALKTAMQLFVPAKKAFLAIIEEVSKFFVLKVVVKNLRKGKFDPKEKLNIQAPLHNEGKNVSRSKSPLFNDYKKNDVPINDLTAVGNGKKDLVHVYSATGNPTESNNTGNSINGDGNTAGAKIRNLTVMPVPNYVKIRHLTIFPEVECSSNDNSNSSKECSFN